MNPIKDSPVFATFLPGCENIHLTKDVGMIGYILHRDFGYDSYILCNKNGDYPSLKTEVPGLKLLFMNTKRNTFIEKLIQFTNKRNPVLAGRIREISNILYSLPTMFGYSKNIDVFQLYHFKVETIIMALIYRVLNKKGIIYVKLDMNENNVKECEEHRKKHPIVYAILQQLIKLSSVNFFSIENKELQQRVITGHPVLKTFKDRIYYLPNGLDIERLLPLRNNYDEKENIILHVGRIGSYAKGSEIILESFSNISREFPTWKLILIGNIEDSFKEHLTAYTDDRYLKDKLFCIDFITSKEKLYDFYAKSRVLAFPSRYESFGLVAVEAGFFGNVIVGTDILPTREITNNGTFGYLCPVEDVDCFTRTLRYALSHEEELRDKSNQSSEFIKNSFDWHKICEELDKYISHYLIT